MVLVQFAIKTFLFGEFVEICKFQDVFLLWDVHLAYFVHVCMSTCISRLMAIKKFIVHVLMYPCRKSHLPYMKKWWSMSPWVWVLFRMPKSLASSYLCNPVFTLKLVCLHHLECYCHVIWCGLVEFLCQEYYSLILRPNPQLPVTYSTVKRRRAWYILSRAWRHLYT